MEDKTLLYNLADKLKYTKKGDFEETAQLEIDAPSYETMKESTVLAQAFAQALMARKDDNAPEQAEQADEKDLDGAAVKFIMMAAPTSFSDVIDAFVALAQKACTLDQERKVKLRKEHVSKIALDDTINFACEYIATFIVPSVLSGLSAEGRKS